MRILIIEDDQQTSGFIRRGLTDMGHETETAFDGATGLKLAAVKPFDVVIVDRMLPGLDGLSIVASLRRAEVKTPILFVTSLGGIDDRVDGLEAGGDDYLVKPFALAELVARINALGRRTPLKQEETVLTISDLVVNLITRVVMRGSRQVDLQPREFKLLEVLMRNKQRVLTRSMLLEQVWDFHFDPKTSIVETHISRLRSKIDRDFDKPLIRTVRGAGYSISDVE